MCHFSVSSSLDHQIEARHFIPSLEDLATPSLLLSDNRLLRPITLTSQSSQSAFYIYIMPISLEALAMSGTDYSDYGMDIQEWELLDSETPPHLLADEEEQEVIRPVFRLLSDWKTNTSSYGEGGGKNGGNDNEVRDGFRRKIDSGRGLDRIQKAKLGWLESFGKMMINTFIRLLMIFKNGVTVVVGGRITPLVSA
ncbi:hypothetical protein RHSIM_Rhsim10G0164400 [Rhododendron simsii]|uniref:Uncharacterized protein n=1 Tax=Rhododendron simsii TaxID=118357 RepID=A0A834GFC2_RHOSS|nr:hypothetical protein RHSIM_Rhsim10G0164400 [Rhododendron simsii]